MDIVSEIKWILRDIEQWREETSIVKTKIWKFLKTALCKMTGQVYFKMIENLDKLGLLYW